MILNPLVISSFVTYMEVGILLLPIVCDSYLNVVSAIYSFPIFKYFIFECCHNRVCMLKLC